MASPQIDDDRDVDSNAFSPATATPYDALWCKPGQLRRVLRGSRIGVQWHVHDTRQLTRQIDDDPVGRV